MRQLVDQKQWDVRHGGLLGLKYLLAARADLGPQLLPEALPAALLGLKVSQLETSPLPGKNLAPQPPRQPPSLAPTPLECSRAQGQR